MFNIGTLDVVSNAEFHISIFHEFSKFIVNWTHFLRKIQTLIKLLWSSWVSTMSIGLPYLFRPCFDYTHCIRWSTWSVYFPFKLWDFAAYAKSIGLVLIYRHEWLFYAMFTFQISWSRECLIAIPKRTNRIAIIDYSYDLELTAFRAQHVFPFLLRYRRTKNSISPFEMKKYSLPPSHNNNVYHLETRDNDRKFTLGPFTCN